ncbi:MAG: hypothetical protein JSU96_01170 [Acidobacteriota bacterium]|nr:MAG: hypothetical protein JSU96_01170 [Acidobacteriota bacterium]
MTQLAWPEPTERASEIATGYGYQAAVLSRVVAEVYSIVIADELAARAPVTLQRLDYQNVQPVRGMAMPAGWKPALQVAKGRLTTRAGLPSRYQEWLSTVFSAKFLFAKRNPNAQHPEPI